MITTATIVICLVAFLGGLLILKILCKLLRFSAKIVFRLIGNAIVGAVILVVFNLVGGAFGVNIELSAFNSLLVGILGIPGVILLWILG